MYIFKSLICVLVAVLSQTALSNTRIPNTDISFILPDHWEPIKKDGFSQMLTAGTRKLGVDNSVAEVIEQVNTYGFIKQLDENREKVNSTMVFVVMDLGLDRIDIKAVLAEHVAQKKLLQGVVSVSPNECPEIKLPSYSCLTQFSKRGSREVVQYHYVSQLGSIYFQFSINAPIGDEVTKAKSIISSFSTKI